MFAKGQCEGQITSHNQQWVSSEQSQPVWQSPRGTECQSPTALPKQVRRKEEGGLLFLDTVVAKPGSPDSSTLTRPVPSYPYPLTCDLLFSELPPRLRNAGARWPLQARLLADWPTGCLQLAWTGRVRPQPADCSVLPLPPASCPTSSLSLGAWRPKAGRVQ